MSIVWMYHSVLDPHVGGTERVTHSVMTALAERGYPTADFLVFRQDYPRAIYDQSGHRIDDLYGFLQDKGVSVVVNQIGYSKWLLEEFLARGGRRWKNEGGRIVSCLHFGPSMFTDSIWALTRRWRQKSVLQKVRRLGRIALLPITNRKIARTRKADYAYVIEQSDNFVILAESHHRELCAMSRTRFPDRICALPNPNTFLNSYSKDKLQEKRKTVLIVSRLEEVPKRISLALLAWSRVMNMGGFDDWTLQVIGDGECSDDYRNLVAKRRIRNVEFVGRTDPETYYESASLYLHTACSEGWGLTITEAMQKGVVPIVMNSSIVFEELITDGRSGILSKNGDVEAFAANIAGLMRDKDRREKLAVEAMESVKRYDRANVVEKWISIINPG